MTGRGEAVPLPACPLRKPVLQKEEGPGKGP